MSEPDTAVPVPDPVEAVESKDAAETFPPASGAPPGTLHSLPLLTPIKLGSTVYSVLHFPEMRGEHLELLPVGRRATLGEYFAIASNLGTYPLVLFKSLKPKDVGRFMAMMLQPDYLGE